jgi:hypothetical protein
LRYMTGLFTGHCHLKGHPFKVGLVNSLPMKSAITKEKQPQTLYEYVTLSLLLNSFCHLGIHFMKPSDYHNAP